MGQGHGRAKYTDDLAAYVLEMHSAGWGYRKLARALQIPRDTIRDICTGATRNALPARFKDTDDDARRRNSADAQGHDGSPPSGHVSNDSAWLRAIR
jgi:hypothetical protein